MWLTCLQCGPQVWSGCLDEEGGGCVAGARVIDDPGVVHQKHKSAGQDGLPGTRTGFHQITFVEEIEHFREQDQVEASFRPLLRHLHLLDADIGI